jgi:hypothetical protein
MIREQVRARRWALAAALVTVLLAGSSARAQPELYRAGHIVGGLDMTYAAEDCRTLPDCGTWVSAGCPAGVENVQPSWVTAIADVAGYADGRTTRWFEFGPDGAVGSVGGGVAMQFWRADCTEIRAARWHSWSTPTPPDAAHPAKQQLLHALTIPLGATWMTVAANDNDNLVWYLTQRRPTHGCWLQHCLPG